MMTRLSTNPENILLLFRDFYVGVFYHGHLFALSVTDPIGILALPVQLRTTIGQIIAQTQPADAPGISAPVGFADISALGSGFLAEHLPALRAVGDNEHTYQRLKNLLFTIDITDELLATFTPEIEEYHEQASHYQVEIIEVDRLLPVENYPMKLSRDACAQLMMSTAQYLTFQHIRAVYEAVDMREFRAGRTECLRAATPEAVRFATALAQGDATENLLIDALNAHRIWVKKCKAGSGMDRHLQLLEATAIADNTLMASDPFFTGPAIRSARRDFLSTTSVGGPDQIIRYAFAPTIPEGFGISYTPNPAHGEFCVSWHDQTTEDPETFLANLRRAGEMFWEFVDSLPRPDRN
ncbi:choline/carnitine O-acyltransferase [Auritidibacter ignavus]|uniref:choline/carnitine O-acyltransferase n=1 Tax=Auritidibacter ignavus TaxID=678932 RepID=UPI00244B08B2|nr:choline/carnitine O-acyltransferase [Auritidibacter ignavus]WGH89973.1 choline/carnitine O-acyltransferase [Auritidibacter ignavus]